MAYMALYRKHRSRTFDEVLGQDHITRTLKNQIMNDKIAHAYLFCGIRGTGKTSIAKIIGKAVNCLSPKEGNPCLECEICRGIANESLLNVVEIDAASNTGVDDIRTIREDALYMPASGKYKVYIIDEVHMLSKSAFNALLKILEEPPKHVIFVLATTEVQKIPATILSRCQKFDLKRISKKMMAERMTEYVEEEGAKIEPRAIEYITELSEGSMRDGLSILEQVISIKEGEEITFDDVLEVLGNVDYSTYNVYTNAISDGDIKKAIEIIGEIYDSGKDVVTFAGMYSSYLRNLILLSANADATLMDMSDENASLLATIAKKIPQAKLTKFLEEFLKAEKEMKYASMPKLTLELLTIRMCKLDDIKAVSIAPSNTAPSGIVKVSETKKPRIVNRVKAVEDGDIDGVIGAWNAIVDATKEMTVRVKLEQVEIIKLEQNHVYMTAPLATVVDCVESYKARLEKALPTVGGKQIVIHVADANKLEKVVNKANNTPKLDDNKIEDLEAQFANSGIDFDIE